MTTYHTAFLSEIDSEFDEIPLEKRIYLQERLRHRLYDLIVGEFIKHQSANPNFTKAALARRIGRRPEVINRWLSSPGNWTLDTVSNLLAGISRAELGLSVNRFAEYPKANLTRPEWLDDNAIRTYSPPPPPAGSSTIRPPTNLMRRIKEMEMANG